MSCVRCRSALRNPDIFHCFADLRRLFLVRRLFRMSQMFPQLVNIAVISIFLGGPFLLFMIPQTDFFHLALMSSNRLFFYEIVVQNASWGLWPGGANYVDSILASVLQNNRAIDGLFGAEAANLFV